MNRRTILKALILGNSTTQPSARNVEVFEGSEADGGILSSRWHVVADMHREPEVASGMAEMNWEIKNGGLICTVHSPDNTVYLSDYLLSDEDKSFKTEMIFRFCDEPADQEKHQLVAGLRFSNPQCDDEQEHIIDTGLTRDGRLFIGEVMGAKSLEEDFLIETLRIVLSVIPRSGGGSFAKLRVYDRSGNTRATVSSTRYNCSDWQGSIAVLSHYTGNKFYKKPSVVINNFKVTGERLIKIESHDNGSDYINSEIKIKYEQKRLS